MNISSLGIVRNVTWVRQAWFADSFRSTDGSAWNGAPELIRNKKVGEWHSGCYAKGLGLTRVRASLARQPRQRSARLGPDSSLARHCESLRTHGSKGDQVTRSRR